MNKEHLPDLEGKSEADLRILLRQSKATGDYHLELHVCRALLPFEDRTSLALSVIKELEQLVAADQDLEE
jgi:hypothetical protein